MCSKRGGKEQFYTNRIIIGCFMRSAFQAASSYIPRSPLEFRRILIHDVCVVSKRQPRFTGHGYIHTVELYDG